MNKSLDAYGKFINQLRFFRFFDSEISTKIITSNIWWENQINRFYPQAEISIIILD
ncbi:hypothetical protein [Hydrocoleum sp. CS-953]|uniref:hypothetical protein n=1 Tax=Microcoleaceae TaxID=1892252 RepID=UPI00143DA46B|nr:hypothetical protein [Hydrocoleum sp. CS-953]